MVESIIEHLPYFGVAVILLLTGAGLPVPEDVPLLIAGVVCGLGGANIYIMLPLCFVAVIGGDVLMFTMGRLHGERLRKLPLLRRYLSDERLARVAYAYHNHVGKTLFSARFLPGLRTPLFFTAGSIGIPYWKLLVFDGGAALISVPALVLLGYFGANNKDQIMAWVRDAQYAIVGVVLLTVVICVVVKLVRRRKPMPSGQ